MRNILKYVYANLLHFFNLNDKILQKEIDNSPYLCTNSGESFYFYMKILPISISGILKMAPPQNLDLKRTQFTVVMYPWCEAEWLECILVIESMQSVSSEQALLVLFYVPCYGIFASLWHFCILVRDLQGLMPARYGRLNLP